MASFWNNPPDLQIKQQHRWVVSFGNVAENYTPADTINGTLPTWLAKAVDKPSFTNKSVQAKYLYSHTFNFPTRVIWNPVKITLYDAYIKQKSLFYYNPKISNTNESISDDVLESPAYLSSQLFFAAFLQKAGYFNPEELNSDDKLLRFRKYTFKQDMVDALIGRSSETTDTRKFNSFNITELDGNGEALEAWKLYNPIITDVNFDKLDYSSENVVTINATIAYDWAELSPRTQNLTINQISENDVKRKRAFSASGDQQFAELEVEEQLRTIVKDDKFSTEQVENLAPLLAKGTLDLLPKKSQEQKTQKEMVDAAIKKLKELEPRSAGQAAEKAEQKQIIVITPE